MNQDLERVLYQAAALTFEQMGFMFVTPELAEVHRHAPVQGAAAVEFTGSVSGKLVLTVRGNLLPTIAANMLGEDEPPPEPQQHDALGEIANVICGNILPRIADPKEVFRIHAPQVLAGARTPEPRATGHAAVAHVSLDDGMADLELFLNERAA